MLKIFVVSQNVCKYTFPSINLIEPTGAFVHNSSLSRITSCLVRVMLLVNFRFSQLITMCVQFLQGSLFEHDDIIDFQLFTETYRWPIGVEGISKENYRSSWKFFSD